MFLVTYLKIINKKWCADKLFLKIIFYFDFLKSFKFIYIIFTKFNSRLIKNKNNFVIKNKFKNKQFLIKYEQ